MVFVWYRYHLDGRAKDMKKIIFTLCAMLCVSALTGCSKNSDSGKKDQLIVAMELAYAPFETKDEAGNPTGISADFMKAFEDYIGKDIKIENTG